MSGVPCPGSWAVGKERSGISCRAESRVVFSPGAVAVSAGVLLRGLCAGLFCSARSSRAICSAEGRNSTHPGRTRSTAPVMRVPSGMIRSRLRARISVQRVPSPYTLSAMPQKLSPRSTAQRRSCVVALPRLSTPEAMTLSASETLAKGSSEGSVAKAVCPRGPAQAGSWAVVPRSALPVKPNESGLPPECMSSIRSSGTGSAPAMAGRIIGTMNATPDTSAEIRRCTPPIKKTRRVKERPRILSISAKKKAAESCVHSTHNKHARALTRVVSEIGFVLSVKWVFTSAHDGREVGSGHPTKKTSPRGTPIISESKSNRKKVPFRAFSKEL